MQTAHEATPLSLIASPREAGRGLPRLDDRVKAGNPLIKTVALKPFLTDCFTRFTSFAMRTGCRSSCPSFLIPCS